MGSKRRTLARWAFHTHLWLGVMVTAVVLLISITGILLNHKRALGLMVEVRRESHQPLAAALSLDELTRLAEAAAGPDVAGIGVDRMDVRPSRGLMKVRFGDARVTEVTVDLHTGEALLVSERRDVFLERLHSGEIFGDGWVLLSDAAAVALMMLLGTGYWIWLYPRTRL